MHCCDCVQLDVSYSVKSEIYGWFALKEKKMSEVVKQKITMET